MPVDLRLLQKAFDEVAARLPVKLRIEKKVEEMHKSVPCNATKHSSRRRLKLVSSQKSGTTEQLQIMSMSKQLHESCS